jgi:hypothetical protein
MTDEAKMYKKLGREFAEHGTTLHGGKQYVDPNDRTIHTNTVEGAFSIFKRGMKGVYQHCGEQHLHRYLAKFEFRYNMRAPTASMIAPVPPKASKVSLASVSPTQGLTSTSKPKRRNRRSGRDPAGSPAAPKSGFQKKAAVL